MKELQESLPEQQNEAPQETMVQAEDLQALIDELRTEQNLPMGILGGLAGAIGGALLWAIITVVTNYQISYMAIGVAYLVSYGMLTLGKGIDPIFGYVGASLALLGCLLGDFFYFVHYAAQAFGATYMQALGQSKVIISLMWKNGDVLTLLFYAIAVYVGYRFSFGDPTAEEEDEDE